MVDLSSSLCKRSWMILREIHDRLLQFQGAHTNIISSRQVYTALFFFNHETTRNMDSPPRTKTSELRFAAKIEESMFHCYPLVMTNIANYRKIHHS